MMMVGLYVIGLPYGTARIVTVMRSIMRHAPKAYKNVRTNDIQETIDIPTTNNYDFGGTDLNPFISSGAGIPTKRYIPQTHQICSKSTNNLVGNSSPAEDMRHIELACLVQLVPVPLTLYTHSMSPSSGSREHSLILQNIENNEDSQSISTLDPTTADYAAANLEQFEDPLNEILHFILYQEDDINRHNILEALENCIYDFKGNTLYLAPVNDSCDNCPHSNCRIPRTAAFSFNPFVFLFL